MNRMWKLTRFSIRFMQIDMDTIYTEQWFGSFPEFLSYDYTGTVPKNTKETFGTDYFWILKTRPPGSLNPKLRISVQHQSTPFRAERMADNLNSWWLSQNDELFTSDNNRIYTIPGVWCWIQDEFLTNDFKQWNYDGKLPEKNLLQKPIMNRFSLGASKYPRISLQ